MNNVKYNLKNLSYGDTKRVFVRMIGDLIRFAYVKGFELGFPDCRLKHKKDSLHFMGLAKDLDLYLNGVYLDDGTGHDILHDYWDTLGGAERIKGDSNHYSVEWRGRR